MSFQAKLTEILNEIPTTNIMRLEKWLIEVLSRVESTYDEKLDCYISVYIDKPDIFDKFMFAKEVASWINTINPRIVCKSVCTRKVQWCSGEEPLWRTTERNTKLKIYYSKDPNNKYLERLRQEIKTKTYL
jgi:ribonucleotide reductase alpha subunit